MGKKAALHNLGCKVNEYETEAMEQLLREAGYEIVPFAPGADVYVINTCTVTNIADRKSRQMLHRARAMNPDAVVVAAGCYIQKAGPKGPDAGMLPDGVDIILGNNHKSELLEALRNLEREGRQGKDRDRDPVTCLGDLSGGCSFEEMSLDAARRRTRASLKVQDGCSQFCSYCIIPYVRGRIRSRRPEDVAAEAARLADSGCRELVLTGIHLSSYGKDVESTLLELILRVHEIPGIARIRLGSLEPGIITEDFAGRLSSLEKFCPHFHLSLQSGCDATLRRMNRHYTCAQYREKCLLLREYFDRPALTTDVIAGFPGETEEEFAQTLDFLTGLCLYETHIFKYSRRRGTRADAMPGQVPESVKARRSERLIALGETNRLAYEESRKNSAARLLTEERITVEGKDWMAGYTDQYIRAAVPCPAGGEESNRILTGKLGCAISPHLYRLEA